MDKCCGRCKWWDADADNDEYKEKDRLGCCHKSSPKPCFMDKEDAVDFKVCWAVTAGTDWCGGWAASKEVTISSGVGAKVIDGSAGRYEHLRVSQGLKECGIRTVGELAITPKSRLLAVHNFGRWCLRSLEFTMRFIYKVDWDESIMAGEVVMIEDEK